MGKLIKALIIILCIAGTTGIFILWYLLTIALDITFGQLLGTIFKWSLLGWWFVTVLYHIHRLLKD